MAININNRIIPSSPSDPFIAKSEHIEYANGQTIKEAIEEALAGGSGGGGGDQPSIPGKSVKYNTTIYYGSDNYNKDSLPQLTTSSWDTANNILLNCPSGWSTSQTELKYKWFSFGFFDEDGTQVGTWSSPLVTYSGETYALTDDDLTTIADIVKANLQTAIDNATTKAESAAAAVNAMGDVNGAILSLEGRIEDNEEKIGTATLAAAAGKYLSDKDEYCYVLVGGEQCKLFTTDAREKSYYKYDEKWYDKDTKQEVSNPNATVPVTLTLCYNEGKSTNYWKLAELVIDSISGVYSKASNEFASAALFAELDDTVASMSVEVDDHKNSLASITADAARINAKLSTFTGEVQVEADDKIISINKTDGFCIYGNNGSRIYIDIDNGVPTLFMYDATTDLTKKLNPSSWISATDVIFTSQDGFFKTKDLLASNNKTLWKSAGKYYSDSDTTKLIANDTYYIPVLTSFIETSTVGQYKDSITTQFNNVSGFIIGLGWKTLVITNGVGVETDETDIDVYLQVVGNNINILIPIANYESYYAAVTNINNSLPDIISATGYSLVNNINASNPVRTVSSNNVVQPDNVTNKYNLWTNVPGGVIVNDSLENINSYYTVGKFNTIYSIYFS